VDCDDADCCRQLVCVNSARCPTVPDPLDIVLRRQPASSSSSFFDRVKFLIDDDSVQRYASRSAFDRRSVTTQHSSVASLPSVCASTCWRCSAITLCVSVCVCVCVCVRVCGWYRRVSVVRGQVVDVHGAALVGVRVSVITQPLYGFTLTRPHHAQYVTSHH